MQFKEVVSGENIQNRPEMKKLLEYVMEGVLEGVLVVDSGVRNHLASIGG